MATKKCTAACKNLRSVRYGFDNSRIVGASFDKRDRLATCALRPNETIYIRTEPECLLTSERIAAADRRLEELDRDSERWEF